MDINTENMRIHGEGPEAFQRSAVVQQEATPKKKVTEQKEQAVKLNISASNENRISAESRVTDGEQAMRILGGVKTEIVNNASKLVAAQANQKAEDVAALAEEIA